MSLQLDFIHNGSNGHSNRFSSLNRDFKIDDFNTFKSVNACNMKMLQEKGENIMNKLLEELKESKELIMV